MLSLLTLLYRKYFLFFSQLQPAGVVTRSQNGIRWFDKEALMTEFIQEFTVMAYQYADTMKSRKCGEQHTLLIYVYFFWYRVYWLIIIDPPRG